MLFGKVLFLGAFGTLVLSTRHAAGSLAELWQTAQGTGDRLKRMANVPFEQGHPPSGATLLAIDKTKKYQTMEGFGGAFTDSAAHVFSQLDTETKQKVINMYFSEDGLQYSMARLPIGSCDFSYNHYVYDNISGDTTLEHFNIDHDRAKIIPLIEQAMKTRANWTGGDSIKIVASPWSAPSWMKENHARYCPIGCSLCTVQEQYRDTWAMYFVKFIAAYKDAGIPIWGVTVQNEPGACSPVYETMHFTAETEKDFIAGHLGKTLRDAFPDVKLLIYDHNKDKVVEWVRTIFANKTIADFVWGTAVHWYSGDDFPNLNQAHELYPDKPILATESTVKRESHPTNPLWKNGEHYGHDMIGDFNNWVVGFIDWNLMLDMFGGPDHAGPDECEGWLKCGSDGMLLINTTSQTVYPQIFYYYMGHFSKFIKPGSIRIGLANTSPTVVEATAFATPSGSSVLVTMNRGDSALNYSIFDSSMSAYVSMQLPPHSIQTVKYGPE